MIKAFLVSASVVSLCFLSISTASAWDGDDTGKSRRTTDDSILVEVAVETIRMIVVLTAIAMITIAVLTGSVTTTARADLRLL